MRRKARECALQLIYQLDMHGVLTDGRVEPAEVDEPIRAFWASFDSVTKDEQGFAERIVEGVLRQLPEVDAAIEMLRPDGSWLEWSKLIAVFYGWPRTNCSGVMTSPRPRLSMRRSR